MADDFEALDAYSTAVVRVAESVLPSVASLRVLTRRGEGAGSASVLTTDGFLLTSAHTWSKVLIRLKRLSPTGPGSERT